MSADTPRDNNKINTVSEASSGMPQGTENAPEVPDYVSEDIYRFWKNNGSRILIYSGALLVAVLGTQIWGNFSASREGKLREQYAGLATVEEKEAFAESHQSHGLAGYTYLNSAKTSYEASEYAKALEYYEKAEKSLSNTEIEGLVQIGKAACLSELDRQEEAKALLASVAENVEFAKGIRAEAMFKSIVIAASGGQDDVVESYTAKLEAIDDTGIWAQRLRSIKYYQ